MSSMTSHTALKILGLASVVFLGTIVTLSARQKAMPRRLSRSTPMTSAASLPVPKGLKPASGSSPKRADLPTKFARIVVTDDSGRYVVPDLPKAKYQVWVRGYGLVDSPKTAATPGSGWR